MIIAPFSEVLFGRVAEIDATFPQISSFALLLKTNNMTD